MKYLTNICFIVLFAWISFFPQPIQDRYAILTRAFLCIFLFILFLDKNHRKHLFSFKDWPLWLFLAGISLNIISAVDKGAALKTYIYLAVTFAIVFYIGKAIFYHERDRKFISIVICACSGLVAFIGLLEFYFGRNVLYEHFISNPFYQRYIHSRVMSTQLHASVCGSFLLGCLPFNFFLFKDKKPVLRATGIVSFLLSIFVIFLTFARGVFLGLVVFLSFYLWKKNKKAYFFMFILSVIFLMLICSFQNLSIARRFGFEGIVFGYGDSIFSGYRLERYKISLDMIKDHPFSGVGLNNFRIRFNEYCSDNLKGKEMYEFMIPDNMYLTLLTESGIIGLSGFLIFLFFIFKKSRSIILTGGLLGLLVNMGSYELFYWNNPFILLCLIFGFIEAAKNETYA